MFKKFDDLIQGDKTVTKYVNEFEALSKYGQSFIDTPEKKNDKFVTGFNDTLSAHLLNNLKDSYEDLVNTFLRFEARFPRQMQSAIVREEPKAPKGGKRKRS